MSSMVVGPHRCIVRVSQPSKIYVQTRKAPHWICCTSVWKFTVATNPESSWYAKIQKHTHVLTMATNGQIREERLRWNTNSGHAWVIRCWLPPFHHSLFHSTLYALPISYHAFHLRKFPCRFNTKFAPGDP